LVSFLGVMMTLGDGTNGNLGGAILYCLDVLETVILGDRWLRLYAKLKCRGSHIAGV